jgi:hypothetical protein
MRRHEEGQTDQQERQDMVAIPRRLSEAHRHRIKRSLPTEVFLHVIR